ncbi:Katanin p60 ATPase-containing subunit A-like 2, partial [Camelus dromedarius]
MLRRLEKRILVGLPSREARQAMIHHWLPPVSRSSALELRAELEYSVLGRHAVTAPSTQDRRSHRELDRAMLRRLEKRILVGLPSREARQAMIHHWLPPVSRSSALELRAELEYSVLGRETEGYSGSDIKLVCREAAMRPVRKIFSALENHQSESSHLPGIQLDTVTTADFLDVLAHSKPSAKNLTHRYAAWQ